MMLYGLPPPEPEIVKIRVLMLKDTKATLDGGATVNEFEEGQEYDLPDWLAEAFFRGGEADPAEAHMQPTSDEKSESAEADTAVAPSENARKRKSSRRAEFGAGKGA